VILLSNNLRHDLSEPLRSRCIYTWLEAPSPEQEVLILRRRVPEAEPSLVAGVVKIINCIRHDMPNVRDKPGIRESLDLLEVLALDKVRELTAEVIGDYLSFLGKKQKELLGLSQGAAWLEWAARAPDPKIDQWVQRAFAQTERRLEMAA